MKLISLNCRQGSRDRDKTSIDYGKNRMKSIATYIDLQKPDILCLQELTFPATRYIPNNYQRITWGFSHSIWINKNSDILYGNGKGRIFADYVDIFAFNSDNCKCYQNFRVINVHGRGNSGAKKAMLKLFEKWRHHSPTIAVGDFNNTYTQMGIEYGEKHPVNQDTFENFTKPDSHGEIDLCYSSSAIVVNSINIGSTPNRLSDHKPLEIEFNIQ